MTFWSVTGTLPSTSQIRTTAAMQPEDSCDRIVADVEHGQRRIGEKRVAGADRVDQDIDEAVDDEIL